MAYNSKMSVSTILFYASMGVVTLWLILKVTGVINTPVWLEYGVPLGGLIIAFLTFYRDIFKEIRVIGADVIALKMSVTSLTGRMDHVERDVEVIKSDVKSLKK